MGSASWMPSKWVSRSRQTSSPAYSAATIRKKRGVPFHRLHHEEGDGIDIASLMPGEVAVDGAKTTMTARIAQKGSSWRMFEMRMRVSERTAPRSFRARRPDGHGQPAGDQRPLRAKILLLVSALWRRGGPARPRSAPRPKAGRERRRRPAKTADARPDQAVVEKDSAPRQQQGVLLEDRPVAGDAVEQAEADGSKMADQKCSSERVA
jgi:hypothetical protein